MGRMLIRKYVGESLLLGSACAVALFAFSWVRVWIVSLFEMSRFQTVVEQFREYEKFSPIPFDQLVTYEGRIGMTFGEPVVVLCVVVWCVARGSDVVSGELGRGTLEMLVTQPVSRVRLMASHGVVATVGLALLALAVWAGIAAGVQTTEVTEQPPAPVVVVPLLNFNIPVPLPAPEPITVPMADRVDPTIYAASVLNFFAFGFFLLALSAMVSSFDRYRWRTVGLVVGFYVIQLVMFGLGKAKASLAWLLTVTLFNYYRPEEAAQWAVTPETGGPWQFTATVGGAALLGPLGHTSVLLLLGAAMYAVAFWQFSRRDLPAPL